MSEIAVADLPRRSVDGQRSQQRYEQRWIDSVQSSPHGRLLYLLTVHSALTGIRFVDHRPPLKAVVRGTVRTSIGA